MGKAKRKASARARAGTGRSWATGSITIYANAVECFSWTGTKQDAIALQKRFIETANTLGVECHSYACRAAGYLMINGMPRIGDEDRRPSRLGQRWGNEVEVYKAAILWLVMREHVPDSGQKVEDVFVGKSLVAIFDGDKEEILDATMRELRGEPFDLSKQFQMKVGVVSHQHRLDPRNAVSTTNGELFALAGDALPPDEAEFASKPIYVPRIPISADEAKAMLTMTMVLVDATDPNAATDLESAVRSYAGYTDEELSGGNPSLRVQHK